MGKACRACSISKGAYGWLLTAYEPVYDDSGKCVCYAAADISMRQIGITERNFFVEMISLFNDQFVIAIDRAAFNQGENAQYDSRISDDGINSTLTAKGPSAICQNTVRRLTPLECERLQGFPDGWTDIGDYIDTKGKKRKTSDSARYKALGNSIALPSWVWVLERLSYFCGGDRSMASLFDGIGGFPLIWETLNGKSTCLWASEIEEFPIAVTKRHFS